MKTLLLVGAILAMTVGFSVAEEQKWKRLDSSESEERWWRLRLKPSLLFRVQDKPERNIPRPSYPYPLLNVPHPNAINPEHQRPYVLPRFNFQIPNILPFLMFPELPPPFFPIVHPIYYDPQTPTTPRNPPVTSQTPQPPVDSSANTPEPPTTAPLTATPEAQTPLQP
ncbi:kappa-casein precursor [Ornithorhynchus anatinus]|uniref:Kappa casein n=1 Tax=Ornithorhynchus anatinus TaxID=9258 RepID=D0QJA9_ORNAN|nr:kappa-casein precursor [Ornithorhynchus anatinus]ACU25793.1 kappa casein [Ornithorhynchus anatinus]